MILAIDPGRRGAIAWTRGGLAQAGLALLGRDDLPQLYLRLADIARSAKVDESRIAFFEENTGFIAGSPRTGASMFVFGRATGRAEMALVALGFEIRRVRPTRWQKAIGAPSKRSGESSAHFKGRLATFAREIAPGLNARITRENADALLLLRYGINVLDGTVKSPPKQPTTTL